MAKPAQFDRDVVIQKALNLYWKKGYHATSMRNLQDVVDLRPGSIYSAFGSKEGLFSEVLKQYVQSSLAGLLAFQKSNDSPLCALKLFIKSSINGDNCSVPSGMCMLVKTVAELTEENGELLAQARHYLEMLEAAFADLFAQAIKLGELDDTSEPVYLARILQIQLMGLKTYSHAKPTNIDTNQVIDEIFNNPPFIRAR